MTNGNKNERMLDSDFIKLCRKGSVSEVQAAIANGADVNTRDDKDCPPLWLHVLTTTRLSFGCCWTLGQIQI